MGLPVQENKGTQAYSRKGQLSSEMPAVRTVRSLLELQASERTSINHLVTRFFTLLFSCLTCRDEGPLVCFGGLRGEAGKRRGLPLTPLELAKPEDPSPLGPCLRG